MNLSCLLVSATMLALCQQIHRFASARVVTNAMRYATSSSSSVQSSPSSAEQVYEFATSDSHQASQLMLPNEPYKINKSQAKFHKGRLLDEEDRSLLDQFYRETKQSDPFLGEDLTSEALWRDSQHDDKGSTLRALLDLGPYRRPANDTKLVELPKAHDQVDWSVDHDLTRSIQQEQRAHEADPQAQPVLANYSPTMKLLTLYDPRDADYGGELPLAGAEPNIVGATLLSRDRSAKPKVQSKLAADAVKLHDELMMKPPRDGKVRVRMYYHRAIHDDSRLYGTGPWKYWGHGWGVEFGYDPRLPDLAKDNYQRGYTIERAFGRDFCRDPRRCRKGDPKFFDDPHNVGHYSKQIFAKPGARRQRYEPTKSLMDF